MSAVTEITVIDSITEIGVTNESTVTVTSIGVADISIGGAANASLLTFEPTGTISATNTQDAVTESLSDAREDINLIDDMPSLSSLFFNAIA